MAIPSSWRWYFSLLGMLATSIACVAETTEPVVADERAALDAPELNLGRGTWAYNELPDTQCRDGSPAGVAVNVGREARRLVIYLDGGGWCMDAQTCELNAASAAQHVLTLGTLRGVGGVFDRADASNPLRDWSFAFVPYCTGDLHGGAEPDGFVPDVGPQRFVGYLNMQRILPRLAASFPDLTNVLLMGESAGGFGAFTTSLLVQRAFPSVLVEVLSDAGPPASEAVFAACLQTRARELFGFERTWLAECGEACPDHAAGWQDFVMFALGSLSDRPTGLVISQYDFVMRAFLGTGSKDCSGTLDVLNPQLGQEALRADLLAFRARVDRIPSVSTFYLDSEAHTWTTGFPSFGLSGTLADGSAGGVRLVDWLGTFVSGRAPGHVGP